MLVVSDGINGREFNNHTYEETLAALLNENISVFGRTHAVMAILAIILTFPGWLAAQFHSFANTPPSARNDHRRGRRRM